MIHFRKANIEDASTYAIILNQSWKDTYGKYISIEHIDDEFNVGKLINNFENYIKDKTFELYMIEYNKQIVGILELGSPEDLYKDNMDGIGEIRSLHIKKNFHNLGIGSRTIEYALNRLKVLKYRTCCVWVKKQNENAIKFYEKHHFIGTKYSCEETVDGAPSFVMEKVL